MNYRAACLKLFAEILYSSIEYRFSTETNIVDEIMTETTLPGCSKVGQKLFKDFCKTLCTKIVKETFDETVENALTATMLDLATISEIFDDEEMRQIYEFSKTPVGMKILRNLDIMRDALNNGSIIMMKTLFKKWQSPENMDQMIEFIVKLNETEL